MHGAAVKLACRTVRSANAAWLTEVKSAGGSAASCRIAVQSCLAQSARYGLAVACGPGELLHAASGATISAMARTPGGR